MVEGAPVVGGYTVSAEHRAHLTKDHSQITSV